MAYTGGAAGVVKRLAEILEEPQEPFALDVYLFERGYGRRRRSVNGKKAKRNRTSRLSKLLRAVCDTAVVIHGRTREKKPIPDRRGECRGAREVAELNRFSSASSNKVHNARALPDRGSSHQPDEPKEEIKQVGDDRNIHQTSHSSKEQPSTVPVTPRETTVEHIDDVSLQPDFQVSTAWKDRKWLGRSTQPLGCETSADYLNSKRVLQQRKQLLFDCVKEVIETYRKKDKAGKSKNSDMEPGEIGKIVCEKIVRWGRTRGNEMSIDELLYLEYMETVEEWEDCVHERTQISLKIGDALMEDIINGIVADLI